jgi:hypothetical protein
MTTLRNLFTYGLLSVKPFLLNGIQREKLCIALIRCTDDEGYPKTESHSNKESRNVSTHAQESKSEITTLASVNETGKIAEPSDISASGNKSYKRGRSPQNSRQAKVSHSSVTKVDRDR